ncbi:MAG: methylmalonyl-CoA epimerase [Elusimicrobia bacterium]|nr:methylmalonyl-CoA epimerase [Elusimicrobiota bacterium]
MPDPKFQFQVDHVGVAVRSIEEALPCYRKALGLEAGHREEVASQGVRVAFLQAGQASIELLEPIGEEGPVAKFLRLRGPGLHHVAFRAGELAAQMERLRRAGLPPIESAPRPGARGHQVCFLPPRQAAGVLVELVSGGPGSLPSSR